MKRTILSFLLSDNGIILLASIIGVGGSFALYYHQRRKKREKMRRALLKELESMKVFNQVEKETKGGYVPSADVIATTTYERSSGDIGLLSVNEIETIISFYSGALRLKSLYKARKRSHWAREDMNFPSLDSNARKINEELREELERLGGKRLKAIHQLRKNLNKDHIEPSLFELPEKGGHISAQHPMIQRRREHLLEDESIKPMKGRDDVYKANEDLSDAYTPRNDWISRQKN